MPREPEVDDFRLAVRRDDRRKNRDQRERGDDEESDDRELVSSQASPGVGPETALLARGQLSAEPDRRRVALPRSDRVLDQVLDFPWRSGHSRVRVSAEQDSVGRGVGSAGAIAPSDFLAWAVRPAGLKRAMARAPPLSSESAGR